MQRQLSRLMDLMNFGFDLQLINELLIRQIICRDTCTVPSARRRREMGIWRNYKAKK